MTTATLPELAHPAILSPKSEQDATISFIGARAFLIDPHAEFSLATQRRIWALARALLAQDGMAEIIPGMTNLLVIFKEIPDDPDSVIRHLQKEWQQAHGLDLIGKTIEIGVQYGGDYATDLAALCERSGLSAAEVIRIHHEATYYVFALGSAPGFGYLYGLDPRIHMPRKAVPSLSMPRGSVTIGGMQTGVAALTGPNGWNAIGYADLRMFDPTAIPPAVMAPGDIVRFVPERIDL
jgi:KipI family sensor histidine kinase inhibitor